MVDCKEFKVLDKSSATPGRTPKIIFTCGYCKQESEGRMILGAIYRNRAGLQCSHCLKMNKVPMKEVS